MSEGGELVEAPALQEAAADAAEQPAGRDGAANGSPTAAAPPRATTAPLPQQRVSDAERMDRPVAPAPLSPGEPTVTQSAERRAGTETIATNDHRIGAGEARPQAAPTVSSGVAKGSDAAGVETPLPAHPAVVAAARTPDGGEDRAAERPDRGRIPSAVDVGRTASEGAAAPDRTSGGREHSSPPLPQFEPPVATEHGSRGAVDTGARVMPAGPPSPAPQVMQMPPAAGPIELPRVPVAPESADSIVQSMRLQYQRGGGDAVVHIKPEHLGPVTVSLRVENGAVSAVVHAESGEAAEWLKANEQLLRDGLASSGLQLERFAVRRDGHPPDRKPWRQPEAPDRRRRGLQPESTFEITV